MDAFAGVLIVQSMMAYRFSIRFGILPGVICGLYFGANIPAGLPAQSAGLEGKLVC
jgi:hypothetical protein